MDILTTQDGPIRTLTLNRPERRNPITDLAMVDALVGALEEADADGSVRAVILTGAGKAFCSGGDLRQMQPGPDSLIGDSPEATRDNYRQGIQRIPLAMEALGVPVIAAINGAAIGAGCDLTCMCDIRIASHEARFAESFVKLGLIPGDGGAWLLPRIIGFSRATEMALTGEMIDAETALQWGLVSRVVDGAELLPTCHTLAMKIAANPPSAVSRAKKMLRQAGGQSLAEALDTASVQQGFAHQTRDHREAVAAFLEKREPRFTGE
ncbi:MAG: crotonase/enoyl-CoA hydratase family protein [Luminiphilus sp.]